MTLKKERDRFSPPSRIDEALSSLERGNTKPVEDIFDELLTNKIAEGKIAYKEAAQAMRHLRTLAILNNPAKELEPKAPRILDFVVNPTDIASGEPSTLSWLTANATVVTLNGTMVALSGEEQVHPVATSTYELIASNQEGKKVSRIVILTIQKPLSNPPRILDFAAIPTDLTPGEPSTLSWLTADATVVTLNGSVVAPSGEKQVHPPTTSAYELIASNREGKWVSSIVILTVRKPPSNPPDAPAEENPRHGGTLRVALAGEPPSLDMHQEQTFIVAIPLSPVYNTLVMFDPHSYPKIIGDLAQSWTVSEDRMTWIFTLHQGVKFHDGSDLTSADVKASWDKIVFPPQGLVSPRKSEYDTIKSIEAPDPYTVVFHLHYASTSFLSGLAHPANFIYAKKYLDQDPNWYKRHTMGTGPFKLKGYVRGSTLELERNPNYWKQGLPYLDGIKYFIILGDNERAHSILSDHTDIEFRGLNPTFIGVMKNKMGNRLTVAYPGTPVHWGVAINIDKKPFDDERVRKALSLAINRYEMATIIGPLTSMDTLGGPQPPDTLGALTEEELQQLPGFRKDYESSLAEAKQLLQEAGYPNGFKTVLTNRDIKLPYFDRSIRPFLRFS
jgi:hypothetical protein